jgi:hypothetical protein
MESMDVGADPVPRESRKQMITRDKPTAANASDSATKIVNRSNLMIPFVF